MYTVLSVIREQTKPQTWSATVLDDDEGLVVVTVNREQLRRLAPNFPVHEDNLRGTSND